MAADLDTQVEAFRTRPLDQGPYTFLAAAALVLNVPRERARGQRPRPCRDRCQRRDGYREILGLQVTSGEDGAGCGRSSVTWSLAVFPGSSWSPPTLTPDWSPRSERPCPARPGSVAAPTTPSI
ncbi:transposase [Nocardia sp. NPDC055049]